MFQGGAAKQLLAQPSADGSRQEYATSTVKKGKFIYPVTNQSGTVYSDKKPKSSAREVGSGKFSMGERNRVTRIKYPKYSSYAELLKKEPAKAKTVMANLQYASVAGSKIKKKTQFTPLTTIQQNKILAEFPNANFDNGKFGFNQKVDQTNFVRVKKFIDRGYKPRFKQLPDKVKNQLKEKFSEFKDWDFKKFKYGVPDTLNNVKNRKLMMKVKTFINDPKPYIFGFSLDKPGAWMTQQMYRAWEHGNTDYEPIYNKNNKVIGMKEKGKAYYANENVAPSKKTKLINSHPEFNKVQKFVNVANEAKLPLKDLGGYKNTKSLLALFPEGYESIKFSDLVGYLYKEQGVDVTRNAIEKHHLKSLSDMGAPVDSKNLQLLRKDLNTLGNTITQQIKKGDLSRVSDLEKAGVKITVDGKTYGKGFQDPRLQMNRIIGDVTQKVSSLNETQLTKLLGELGCPTAKLQLGGRVKFSNGSACVLKGKKKLNLGLTNGFNKTEGELAKKILQAGKGLKNLASLKGLLGPAAIAFEVAVSAGLVGYDMLATGKSFKEAIGSSLFNYALGDKTKIDNKKLRYQGYADAGVSANQIGKISAYENAIDEINNMSAEFDEENRLYNIAANQKGSGRISPERYKKIKQKQIENYFNQADKNKALIQDLARTQTEDRLNKAIDPMVPALMSDADAKRKAMQMTKPSTVMFGNVMDTIFPSGFFSDTTYKEDRDRAINYMPEVQEYYRGNYFAGGGIAGLSGGDKSGPPPESGPASQGLRSLYKNGRKL
tara:strand:+ start:2651 stop:4969 length:2319 start_codon:yes stop_codon:yes gene_type:complete